jgi:SET domain-containing protein
MAKLTKKTPFETANIEIKQSPIHRYGVFATKDFTPKEIIEVCPVIVFNKLKLKHRDALVERVFWWDDTSNAIALGYGSMYNHSSKEPNAIYAIDRPNQILRFIADKNIAVGSEILIDYGEVWDTYLTPQNNTPLNVAPKNDSVGSSKLIILFLLLLILSRMFPLGLDHSATNTKNIYQSTPTSHNMLMQNATNI